MDRIPKTFTVRITEADWDDCKREAARIRAMKPNDRSGWTVYDELQSRFVEGMAQLRENMHDEDAEVKS